MVNKKIGFFILLFFFLLLLSFFVYFIWKWKNYVMTDAVFVQADRLVYLSFPKVNGRIKKLYKNEGDRVEKGEILAEIEPFDYLAKVKALEENINKIFSDKSALAISKEKLRREIELKLQQLQKEIRSLEEQKRAQIAKIEALKTRLNLLKKDRLRAENLYKEGLISLQSLESKETEERELFYQVEAEEFQLKSIEEKLKVLQKNLLLMENEKLTLKNLSSQIAALAHEERALVEQREEAKLYLTYTQLKSPISGYIAKKFHSEGDVIAPGEPVYSLIDPESIYILVLLEETKLSGVAKGAKAKIKLDAYPGKVWQGEVEEILPASAATFALVPRDISAGEFTKLAQRIPVKIKITEGDRSLLKVGLGGEVEIKKLTK